MSAFWGAKTRQQKGITFSVDNVVPAIRSLPETQLDVSLKMRSDCALVLMPDRTASAAMTPQMQNIAKLEQRHAIALAAGRKSRLAEHASSFTHPLIESVHIAFSEHRPLLLSPDAIWLVIAQGFGIHVRENAEALRSRLVRHADKKELVVVCDGLTEEDWQDAMAAFSHLIRENTDPVLHETLVCDFSTTTPSIRTASEVALDGCLRALF